MSNLVLNYFITDLGIDFRECRGQSYDITTSMGSEYYGMYQEFIPFAAHPINLVGISAFDAANYFGVSNEILIFYSFFTKITAVLK